MPREIQTFSFNSFHTPRKVCEAVVSAGDPSSESVDIELLKLISSRAMCSDEYVLQRGGRVSLSATNNHSAQDVAGRLNAFVYNHSGEHLGDGIEVVMNPRLLVVAPRLAELVLAKDMLEAERIAAQAEEVGKILIGDPGSLEIPLPAPRTAGVAQY